MHFQHQLWLSSRPTKKAVTDAIYHGSGSSIPRQDLNIRVMAFSELQAAFTKAVFS